MVASRVATLKHGGDRKSENIKGQICPLNTQSEAASLLSVSPRSVKSARVVLEHGAPELIEAVERGKASVSAASVVAREEPDGTRARAPAGIVRMLDEDLTIPEEYGAVNPGILP